jgi:hypothetical protein
VVGHADGKHSGDEDAGPWVVLVNCGDVEGSNYVSDRLMNTFYNRVGLRIPSCYRFSF